MNVIKSQELNMIKIHKDDKNFYMGFIESLNSLKNKKNVLKFPGFEEITEQFVSPCEYVIEWKSLTSHQREKLQKLYNCVLDYYRDNKTDEEIAADPEWHKICSLAEEVYKELKDVEYISESE